MPASKKNACRAAIAVFNAGVVLAKHGIKFLYHQHGYELEPFGRSTLMDLFAAEQIPVSLRYLEQVRFWVGNRRQANARPAFLKR